MISSMNTLMSPHFQFIHRIMSTPHTYPTYSIHDGFVYFENKIYIPCGSNLHDQLLSEFHSQLLVGHSGIKVTLAHLAISFFQPCMSPNVKKKKFVHTLSTNNPNTPIITLMASYNLYSFYIKYGRILVWILLPIHPAQMVKL